MKDHGLKHKIPPKKVYNNWGGGTGRIKDLYSYHYTLKYKEKFMEEAEEFDKMRAGPLDRALPNSRGVTTPMSHVAAVKEYLDQATENAEREENQAAESRYMEQFDKEFRDLEKNVFGAMSEEQKSSFYARVEHDLATSAPDGSGITAKDLELDEP
ncbi:hypothetical protein N7478_000981 [Penicillium angulare]|uniref:uncharacterized protein n=1 Tax=Penicillium angulare TaxID=116970 RepID=UPI002541B902|nr:uncharacterized protein N7478_000981 [Penicillium angulare]KAJ5291730.1 hypothetical protein N7478_000981 [Penicillium angulare]